MAVRRSRIYDAWFSEDGAYRYGLYVPIIPNLSRANKRRWLGWCLLNPSTADQDKLDPTLRRCYRYTLAWGYTHMAIVNAFALRSTDPKRLWGCVDPFGFENEMFIYGALGRCERMVVGWGTHPLVRERKQDQNILGWAKRMGCKLYCLGRNKDGSPKHPLYLPKTVKMEAYRGRVT